MFPKKPYGFETRQDDSSELELKLLDMPKESDWTLNATYNDKTLMRDGFTYIIAGRFMDYAPRVRYAEVIINGEYQGVYLVIEKIKRDKNRVNIPKISDTDSTGDGLTGGYIIKIDKTTGSGGGGGWYSPYLPFPGAWQHTLYQFEYPKAENITPAQSSYISNHVTHIEDIMNSDNYQDPITGYRKYIDTKSLADFIIVNELTKNPDAYRLSTFFYKERDSDGGKIKFGPVWDFNLSLGNADYCTNGDPYGLVIEDFNKVCATDGWVIQFWWQRFLADTAFYKELKLRWRDLRQAQLSNDNIFNLVDSLATLVDTAKDRNFERWPVLGQYVWPNYFVGNTYSEEIDFLKGWLTQRLAYLDSVWNLGTNQNLIIKESKKTLISPNPARDIAYLPYATELPVRAVFVTDIRGARQAVPIRDNHFGALALDFSACRSGVYLVHWISGNKMYNYKLIKI